MIDTARCTTPQTSEAFIADLSAFLEVKSPMASLTTSLHPMPSIKFRNTDAVFLATFVIAFTADQARAFPIASLRHFDGGPASVFLLRAGADMKRGRVFPFGRLGRVGMRRTATISKRSMRFSSSSTLASLASVSFSAKFPTQSFSTPSIYSFLRCSSPSKCRPHQ
uniref:Uncharacterized protein n=1 Tax=Odontella aurita TaxID=265563 RepID=A0A7S4HJ08_9STRA